jgi:Ca2+-binding RTX toxin-like protein
MTTHLSPPHVIPAIAAAAVAAALALAAPAAAHGARPVPDAEIFATNNTAVITDPDDPRLDDRLGRFARVVDRIVRRGGARPRGSELLDGVFFSSDFFTTTFERSRRFDVDRVDAAALHDIAETIGTRFHQESVLTFDNLDADDPAVDAIELEVSGVTADALREGLLADQEAAERLFGGSVTLDGHLILIADLADEAFARAFAESIGGDLSRAVTRRGDREFVEAPAPPPFEVRHRRLFVTGGAADEKIGLELRAGVLTVDLDGDGQVDYSTRRRALDRVVVDGGGGQDQLTYTSSRRGQDFDVSAARGRARADGGVPVELDRVERLDLAAPEGPGRVDVGDLSFTTLQELHGAFGQTRLAGTPDRDFVDLSTFAVGPVFVLGLPVLVQIEDAGPADSLRVDGRGGDDQLSGSSLPAGGLGLTIEGGDGSDSIIGGRGDDVLRGGADFDDVTPNRGDDFVDLGGDNNRSSWAPGDGDDHVVGHGGRDSLFFLGSADAERFELSRDGGGVRLTRDVGAIDMDLDGIDEIDTLALGGADTFAVGDLTGTPVDLVDVSLAPSFGSPGGDGQADRVEVAGTDRADAITVAGSRTTARLTGLTATVNVTHAEGALDTLAVDTRGGADTVDSAGLEPGVIGLSVE